MNDLELAQEIERVYREESVAVLVTAVESPSDVMHARMLIQFPRLEQPRIVGDVLSGWLAHHSSTLDHVVESARRLIQQEDARLVSLVIENGPVSLRVMMELIRHEPQLIICGAGHIGQALAPIAQLLGFEVIVIDDRADYASPDLFPDGVRMIVKPFAEALASWPMSPSTSIVIVTRGHKHDESCLRILLDASPRYIGMIGSARRVITVFRRLLDEGYPMAAIERVHAPIGLDIGARTPAEIAVAILAEVILSKHGGTGAPKRHEIKRAVHLKED